MVYKKRITVNGKRKLVHRAIMEEHIGRDLLRSEKVIHLDGDFHNNSIENLEVFIPQGRNYIDNKEYKKKYYINNKEKIKEHNLKYPKELQRKWKRNYNDKIKRRFEEYKLGLKCEKCGEDSSCCLDFHHIEKRCISRDKSMRRVAMDSWNKFLKERDKCIVLCANCHRKVHHGEIDL